MWTNHFYEVDEAVGNEFWFYEVNEAVAGDFFIHDFINWLLSQMTPNTMHVTYPVALAHLHPQLWSTCTPSTGPWPLNYSSGAWAAQGNKAIIDTMLNSKENAIFIKLFFKAPRVLVAPSYRCTWKQSTTRRGN